MIKQLILLCKINTRHQKYITNLVYLMNLKIEIFITNIRGNFKGSGFNDKFYLNYSYNWYLHILDLLLFYLWRRVVNTTATKLCIWFGLNFLVMSYNIPRTISIFMNIYHMSIFFKATKKNCQLIWITDTNECGHD